jgi:hypothetical protein
MSDQRRSEEKPERMFLPFTNTLKYNAKGTYFNQKTEPLQMTKNQIPTTMKQHEEQATTPQYLPIIELKNKSRELRWTIQRHSWGYTEGK